MTAREFLMWSGYEGDFEVGLYLLGQYLGRGNFFVQYPDAEVETEEGIPISEPVCTGQSWHRSFRFSEEAPKWSCAKKWHNCAIRFRNITRRTR